MTFDDWVKDILKIEAREITHLTPEEQKKVYFTVSADDLIKLWNAGVENGVSGMQLKITELETQIEKMKYALNKIIKTVQNDNISGYGDRLVIIYDISCEVLQENEEEFVRNIVYCNNCKKYVMPYGNGNLLWCPKCGVDNRNIEVSDVLVHNMEEQRNITEKLKEANKKGIKIIL